MSTEPPLSEKKLAYKATLEKFIGKIPDDEKRAGMSFAKNSEIILKLNPLIDLINQKDYINFNKAYRAIDKETLPNKLIITKCVLDQLRENMEADKKEKKHVKSGSESSKTNDKKIKHLLKNSLWKTGSCLAINLGSLPPPHINRWVNQAVVNANVEMFNVEFGKYFESQKNKPNLLKQQIRDLNNHFQERKQILKGQITENSKEKSKDTQVTTNAKLKTQFNNCDKIISCLRIYKQQLPKSLTEELEYILNPVQM